MISWFSKHKTFVHRLPVLMALLAGIMFTAMPAGKTLAFGAAPLQKEQVQKSATGEEVPVFEPGFSALAQVAPLQIFYYQPAIVPVIIPLVEIVEQAPANVPDLVNSYRRTLFRRIISPNAP